MQVHDAILCRPLQGRPHQRRRVRDSSALRGVEEGQVAEVGLGQAVM